MVKLNGKMSMELKYKYKRMTRQPKIIWKMQTHEFVSC